MLRLRPDTGVTGGLRVLCLGCHSDDIEIGCGGSILRLAAEREDCVFDWVVFCAIDVRASEAKQAIARFVEPSRLKRVLLGSFPDGFMPFAGANIKAVFEDLKQTISPDLIFTHSRKDAHQDHRLIAELTWNTFRDHLILEYEIPKYDGDLGRPNVFITLSDEICEKKVRYLTEAFPSQRAKRWFEERTFVSLMRLRGMECNSPSGYAEAFYCRKVVLV
jgi:LmbE family N-acetylglucosaminyl deacetylase